MKRKLVTRIISVAVASCMMAGMLTGCGSTGDSTGAGESTSGGGDPRISEWGNPHGQTPCIHI